MTSSSLAAEHSAAVNIDGKYQNTDVQYSASASSLWDAAKAYWNSKRTEPAPTQPLPVVAMTHQSVQQLPDASVTRLGHSSTLIKLDGKLILTDPVFSERASPVQFIGPKRFQAAAIELTELPDIDVVVISHDHYDHLDKASIKALAPKTKAFIVPLGIGELLQDWGVAADTIRELDWWQETRIDSLLFAATPTQHFSGRGLLDTNKRLWASWVIKGQQANIFFSGDSGYFPGFKAIGDTYGPFDLTLIETGAYNEAWSDIHMMPEQSVQANIDLQGRAMMPIHNSTFDLALHNWYEPLERAHQAAQEQQVTLVTSLFGEPVSVLAIDERVQSAWWREVKLSNQEAIETAKAKNLAPVAAR
ncbi:MBL fold metallo-hydrolase [Paraferrimonas haliotis]|uniref:Hydrolase n=1 Tax=Paraferrimonas haliotis TaxID=2013866 RepID=A0AA37WWB0_9GAMM|nr:MBL fold metallo-hydrolase [Paraferrimonas haliotis]GLS83267.1 hydrolase [Paraferrimonas haliotis]